MRIAILGGSFNPVHNGHLSLAENVYTELGYERVLFFPAYISPFKKDAEMLPAEHRCKMLELVTEDNPRFDVDDFELRQAKVSYTIDTVKYCYKNYSLDGKLGLVVGMDLLASFYKWKDAEKLLQLVDLIVGNRPAKIVVENGLKIKLNNPEFLEHSDSRQNHFPDFKELENESLQISSSYIRTAIAQKKAWRYLVPEKIYQYILENRLYEK